MNRNEESNEEIFSKAADALRNSDGAGALFLFMLLAKRGVPEVYCEIGNIYELGIKGVDVNIDQAITWYKKSVDEDNDPIGAYCLGRIYYLGRGVNNDFSKALWYYNLAANSGVHIASLMLGRMYNLGLGVDKDINAARTYFEVAANNGYVYAMKNLGSLELSCGNFIKGARLYMKGIITHLKLYISNRYDPRLRSA